MAKAVGLGGGGMLKKPLGVYACRDIRSVSAADKSRDAPFVQLGVTIGETESGTAVAVIDRGQVADGGFAGGTPKPAVVDGVRSFIQEDNGIDRLQFNEVGDFVILLL